MKVLPKWLTDHESLVGVIRFPKCNYTTHKVNIPVVRHDTEGNYDTVLQEVDMAVNINGINITSGNYTISKSSVTDFFPYTYYVLTDGESPPLIMQPQFLPTSFNIKGRFAISHQPIEQYYPSNYKGSTDGNLYNITNQSQMMLPVATNVGMSYVTANSNTLSQNIKNQTLSNTLGVATSTLSTIATGGKTGGGLINSISSAYTNTMNNDARTKDLMLTPSTISSYGTPSTRNMFNNNRVRIVKYSIQDHIKNKIINFTNRFGNKYNNYGTINLKTYKGYLKMICPLIEGKIDMEHLNKITYLLERGVKVE